MRIIPSRIDLPLACRTLLFSSGAVSVIFTGNGNNRLNGRRIVCGCFGADALPVKLNPLVQSSSWWLVSRISKRKCSHWPPRIASADHSFRRERSSRRFIEWTADGDAVSSPKLSVDWILDAARAQHSRPEEGETSRSDAPPAGVRQQVVRSVERGRWSVGP